MPDQQSTEDELSHNTVGLLWSGLAAGLSTGFSLMPNGVSLVAAFAHGQFVTSEVWMEKPRR
jgi:hypothetical protein